MTTDCTVVSLGRAPYGQAWELQKALAERRTAGTLGDTLLLVEHPHVYTMGRRGSEEEVLLPRKTLTEMGVELFKVDRGGGVTYHGPNQVVAYPILKLHRWGGGPVRYVRALEEALVDTLHDFGIPGTQVEGYTGVWIKTPQDSDNGEVAPPGRKIAAIGVRINRGVTTHGLALNVDPDLRYYDHIVPCGIQDLTVTSMARELGHAVDISDVERTLVKALGKRLGLVMRWARPGESQLFLGGETADPVPSTVPK